MRASRVFLERGVTRKTVAASVAYEITDDHLQQWRETWVPAIRVHCATRLPGEWPEDEHWEWDKHVEELRGVLAFQTFALTCEGELQGLMLTSVLAPSRLKLGIPMIYVELLSTAPWNRPEIESPPRFRGVGKAMIKTAIKLSLAEGYKGRIGLHSLCGAEAFYRDKCGMTDLKMDEQKEMVYFEMTEAQAKAFLRANG